jgi:hypothetical protein
MLGSLLTPLIVHGAVCLVSLLAAAKSMKKVQFGCYYKYVAGTSDLTAPSTAYTMIPAFDSVNPIITTLLAFITVDTPIVIANRGTLVSPIKSEDASNLK